MPSKYININFPFKDSDEGFYVDITSTSKDAIKADLLHLLLTNKGERLYMPDFGSDLKKFIFEMNDQITHEEIKTNLNDTIKKYIPNLQIDSITFENIEVEEAIKVILSYTITEGVFSSTDTIDITF
jgi:phage baseplate assembly protein W|tara:strand:- start:981 stop:1361 length:381 start_codon:yes stop_codon:yes gene_type:complete